eukprot:TRINITY_DN66679_c0_g1_i1.p1 TRINITY_DN66679_c0_g1~~TRINITY_DN66679_c0_g1_i1.p1  ORF type:complete len:285 (+),score=89.07 TRINITY_DN66679_c0_g1_i1:86-856(+)
MPVPAPQSQQEGWDGSGTQTDLMHRDECITVDPADQITGHASKWDAHRFGGEGGRPGGILHRAFSVFLFDQQGRLLLQQRAKSKITFPLVWTNTCCSHPLHGYSPTEVDQPEDTRRGAPGAKRAAQRKLLHELGIDPQQVPHADFKFLTRLHYCAPDSTTAETESGAPVWGEHEVDYILLIRAQVDLKPNPEEVEDTRYVTLPELREMMADPQLRWSPWFRIIVDRFLAKWWADLDTALTTNDYVDDGIHTVLNTP